MSQETFNTQFNFTGFNTLKKDLREATELYQQMLQSGTATTQQMEEQARKVADLKDQIDDANDATAALTGAGRIQAFGRAITAVSGGFTALQGAIALTGVESEDLQKTMVKLQAAMSITVGLSQLEDISNAMKNAARATGLQTLAMRAYTFATNGATVATKALRVALLSLGAGAILVGVGLLIQKLSEAYEKYKLLFGLSDTIAKGQVKTSELTTNLLTNEITKRYEELRKAAENGEKEVQARLDALNQEARQKLIKNYRDNKDLRKKEFDERKKELDEQLVDLFVIQSSLEQTIEDATKPGFVKDILDVMGEPLDFLREAVGGMNMEDQLNFIQNNLKKTKQAISVTRQEISLITQSYTQTEEKGIADLEKFITDSSESVQNAINSNIKEGEDKRKQAQKENEADFKKSVSDFEAGERVKFEAAKKMADLKARLDEATAADEFDLKDRQFQNDRKAREQELSEEIKLAQELKKLYEDRNKNSKISTEERTENEEEIARLTTRITNLQLQQTEEIRVSDTEYANLVRQLQEAKLKKAQEIEAGIRDEQDKTRENLLKNYLSQQDAIDAFYNNRRLAALREIKDERKQQKVLNQIQLESLDRRIKNAEFLGQSTLELEKERSQLFRQMIREDAEYQAATFQATLQIGQALFQGLINLDNIRLQNSLRNENLSNQQKEQIARESFERQKALNISMALMDAAMTVSSIYAQFPKFDGGFMMYAALALAAVQLGMALAQIQATEFVPPSTSSSNIGQGVAGSKFQEGGLIMGPGHSQGGIKTLRGELEGGEFIMNRISSQAFLPLLEQMNAMGNSNSQRMMNPAQSSTPIIKTYVVANDMYSELEKRKKIQKLARL